MKISLCSHSDPFPAACKQILWRVKQANNLMFPAPPLWTGILGSNQKKKEKRKKKEYKH